ncbi:hypothetical protein DRW03_09540 [Corallococcus sp. H22C18031201]|uniref:DUF5335 family protein n=1 Tax=Citreicoccus inhibens TaxID=2849499 RepID=UPI000E709862|nr:DUF5335 family protein [Citreicoccus inhibens]MBJ6760269.1 DUF5335 family protein [Myxococcaceae bacterium JPH2]MBU8895860.1 DUF5335 domain-containing protein [Citreicoccus inhibens]RJS23867.1 hypothetical protein DRW03_09540 [Corallococcus sp. H22C18031201]
MHHTREIPRSGWADYLSLLSSLERDHWVRIETDSEDTGEQPLAQRLPLIEIALEEKGSDQGAIEVMVGRPGDEITHRIFSPNHIYAEESDSGELECLDIEDADHVKTLIYFDEPRASEELPSTT